jgi:iron complex transport system ATP-binding protein
VSAARRSGISWLADDLTFTYPGASRPAVDEVSIEVPTGLCTALLGPNGSGKSTLLRLLLGTLEPARGSVSLEGRPVSDWSRAEMARRVGVVPQGEEINFPITVREMVAMGRYPYLGRWKREGAVDRLAIEKALDRCDIVGMTDRPITTLSGGERQRALLARALAQEPDILVLDEPTAALDVRHEMAIFELLRDLGEGGVTVLLVTHSLNLASRFADRLILLARGRVAAVGGPREVIDQARIEAVYGWPVRVTAHPGPGPDVGAPQVTPLQSTTTNHTERDETT